MKLAYKKYLIKLGSIWAGCLLLLLIANIFVVKPRKTAEKETQKILADKKQTYEAALEAAQPHTRSKLNKQLEELKIQLGEFVAEPEDSAELTFDISQVANNRKISSFSVNARNESHSASAQDRKYTDENKISINFNAGFNQFASFLNALERHRPIIFVDKFTIMRSKRNKSNHKVNMDVVVLVRKQLDS